MNGSPHGKPDYSILNQIRAIESPPRTSFLYQLNLLLVAIVMVLLPVVYLALVGLAAYGVYYHATEHWSWVTKLGVRSVRLTILIFVVYLIPLVTGSVVVFFMIKPLFAGRPKRAQPLALNPADNPLLYAFIEKICETVGAPSPKRIDLNCELNAAAGFRRGYLSMFGNDLVLTLGLPLVANLSAAEFAGVVAHEFGHFTQNVGMRLSYLIRSINFWFARVVYERDSWDEALEEWANDVEDGRVAVVVWISQIGVWFARMLLRLLMYIGLLVSGFLMRQMEYDADAWEIKLSGSESFERTQRKLATLSAAMDWMYKQIHQQWRKTQQLPDNLSELLRQAHESLPTVKLKMIEDASGLERTGLFDSHPSLADRIRRARRAQEPGIFHDERPASSLFSSFEHPARFVTLLHYTDDLDIPVTEPMLLRVKPHSASPTKAASFDPTQLSKDSDILDAYFLGIPALILPIRINPPQPSQTCDADLEELLQITGSLQEVRNQLPALADQYRSAEKRLVQARAAAQLISAGMNIDAAAFGLSAATTDAASTGATEAESDREALRNSVREVATALTRRLELGLAVYLSQPQTESEETSKNNEQLFVAAAIVSQGEADFDSKLKLREALAVYTRLLELPHDESETNAYNQALASQMELIKNLRQQSARKESDSPAPHSTLQLKLTRSQPVSETDFEKLELEVSRWFENYFDALNRLLKAADSVERIPA